MTASAAAATTAAGFVMLAVVDALAHNGKENSRDYDGDYNGWDHTPAPPFFN